MGLRCREWKLLRQESTSVGSRTIGGRVTGSSSIRMGNTTRANGGKARNTGTACGQQPMATTISGSGLKAKSKAKEYTLLSMVPRSSI